MSYREPVTAAAIKRTLKRGARALCSRPPFSRVITWRSTRARNQVALTFDDGPDPEYTPQVLDILDAHRARATFFVLGQHVEGQPELIRRMAGAGHEVGIHGYDHTLGDLPGQTARTCELLADLGVTTDLFRPPGGNLIPGAELWMVRHRYRTVLWSFDLLDSMRHEGKVAERDPLERIGPGDVVLMHDDNPVCTDELPAILDLLDDRGLEPVTVSTLLG